MKARTALLSLMLAAMSMPAFCQASNHSQPCESEYKAERCPTNPMKNHNDRERQRLDEKRKENERNKQEQGRKRK